MSFFGANAAKESSAAVVWEDGVATSDCDSYVSDECWFLKGITAGATDNVFRAKNPVFDSSGWTVASANITDVPASATKGIGFAIEEVAVVAAGQPTTRRFDGVYPSAHAIGLAGVSIY